MGWFSNPRCPQCGVETTVSKEWDSYFYECRPCRRKATREYEEKQKLEQRLSELEEKMGIIANDSTTAKENK